MHDALFKLLLDRPADSHKYQYGHVLIIGGSPGMVGAPFLCARAALRTGAGLVTIAAQPEVVDKLERRVEEIMTLRLPESPDDAGRTIATFINERKVSVLVFGPGLPPDAHTAELLERLLSGTDLPCIIDGGGLGALAGHLDLLRRTGSTILTPHTGEFQRLLGKHLPEERSKLKPLAAELAKTHDAIVALKGQPTYVARPDGPVYENPTGTPGLATAGTGDVLSGVIAGMIAQHIDPDDAVEAAVYLHGLAGEIAAAAKTQPGTIAGDVIEAIPAAYAAAAASSA
jgi:NAD(P)H-hydrate epimerase